MSQEGEKVCIPHWQIMDSDGYNICTWLTYRVVENRSGYPLDGRLDAVEDGSGLGIGKAETVTAADDYAMSLL
jgi:hypothetical protein